MKKRLAWILTLALAALSAGTMALADSGLFPTPGAGTGDPNRPPQGSLFPSPGGLPQQAYPGAPVPDCGSRLACIDYFTKWRNSQIKGVLAAVAEQASLQLPARCIHRVQAFGFENTSGSLWRVNCLAQQRGQLTHVIDFEMDVAVMPAGCASDASIAEWSNSPFAMSPASLSTFAQSLRECRFSAQPRQAPFVSPVNPAWLSKVLETRPEVSALPEVSSAVVTDRRIKVIPEESPRSRAPREAINPLGPSRWNNESAE